MACRGRPHRRSGCRGRSQGARGAARAPAEVRRLVVPQGQARPGRARHDGGRPRGRRGDRARRTPRAAAVDAGVRRPQRATGTKHVHYWVGRVVGRRRRLGVPAERGDRRGRVGPARRGRAAADLPARPGDARGVPRRCRKTHPLVVLRHGKARPRKAWTGDDRQRPLADEGELQAERLVPVLGGVRRRAGWSARPARAAGRPSAPYADVAELDVEVTDDAVRGGRDAGRRWRSSCTSCSQRTEPAVLCTHRPVLPDVVRRPRGRRPEARARRDAGRAPPSRAGRRGWSTHQASGSRSAAPRGSFT